VDAQEIIEAIDDGYERESEGKSRAYIGASIVGNSCEAVLAFNLRGFPNDPPAPKLKRIFQLGHVLEDMVVSDLKKKARVNVFEVDGLTGKQHAYEALGGHIKSHMDGHIEINGEVHVLEVKSMNDASFEKFRKNGVKISHPQYHAQVTLMMGMSGMKKTFLIAVNKNTSEYHAEIVAYDDLEYGFLEEKVNRVLSGQARKISEDETDWRCRGCFKRGVCWGDREVPVACSTCQYASPLADGGWHCHKHDTRATAPCSDYQRYAPIPKQS